MTWPRQRSATSALTPARLINVLQERRRSCSRQPVTPVAAVNRANGVVSESGWRPSLLKTNAPPSMRGRLFKTSCAALLSGLTRSTATLFRRAGSVQSYSVISGHVISPPSARRAPVNSRKRTSAWNGCGVFSFGSVAAHILRISSSESTRVLWLAFAS